jgi:endonuclease G, mitochondrial
MLIKPNLIANSEQRFKQADFSPTELNRKLGDGPIQMSVQKKQLRQRQLLEQTDDPQLVQIGLERIIQPRGLYARRAAEGRGEGHRHERAGVRRA